MNWWLIRPACDAGLFWKSCSSRSQNAGVSLLFTVGACTPTRARCCLYKTCIKRTVWIQYNPHIAHFLLLPWSLPWQPSAADWKKKSRLPDVTLVPSLCSIFNCDYLPHSCFLTLNVDVEVCKKHYDGHTLKSSSLQIERGFIPVKWILFWMRRLHPPPGLHNKKAY